MKVILLYDLDPAWDIDEINDTRESNKILWESLRDEGIETYLEELSDPYMEKILERYDPADTIIFNLCETLPGIPNSERRVLQILETSINCFEADQHLFRAHLTLSSAEPAVDCALVVDKEKGAVRIFMNQIGYRA